MRRRRRRRRRRIIFARSFNLIGEKRRREKISQKGKSPIEENFRFPIKKENDNDNDNLPVFPLVASTTVIPGFNFPLFSASSITANAKRSFTDDKGLKYSHLTYMSTPSGANLLILTMGVSPINDVMFSWMTARGVRATLVPRFVDGLTTRGRVVETDWVNDNIMVRLIFF